MRFINHYIFVSVLAAICQSTAITISAAPGDLDPTFGHGGRVFTTVAVSGFDGLYPTTESMLVQPDGKILVCGRFWEDGIAYWYGTFIVRYLADGTLDRSFGIGGKVAVIRPGGIDRAVGADMALQTDGKIVLIGQQPVAEGILVQRYTSSGMLDTSFGINGTTAIPRDDNNASEGMSIVVRSDGKIVGAGWERDRFWYHYNAIVIFRLNPDGSPDVSFGQEGTGIVKIVNGIYGAKVIGQPDGKILINGTLLHPQPGAQSTPFLARFNNDGTPDATFGNGGRVTHTGGDAALQPDGKVVISGSSLTRYNGDGTLDEAFTGAALSGKIFIASDGKFVGIGDGEGYAVRRLNSDGSLDQSFGVGGTSQAFPMNAGGTNYAVASAGALQPDGKILVGGYFGNYYTDSHDKIALIRVDGATTSVAASISVSGRVMTPDGRALRNAVVSLSDSFGVSRRVITGSFGLYTFDNVPNNNTYVIGVSSKRYRFASRNLVVTDNLTNVDFTGVE